VIDLASTIRVIPDFPVEGILFRDITTLLQDPHALRSAIDELHRRVRDLRVDLVVGMESRGFIFAAPLAYLLGVGLVPVRKLGKLPGDTLTVEYELEYGTNTLEIHRDAISPGQRVLIVDDLLATGGTVLATMDLVRQLGGEVAGAAFLIELEDLGGRARLDCQPVISILTY
jgi:adenine phosphoribosyltransferase